jgi:NADH-quinone oxidoreductase subunit E
MSKGSKSEFAGVRLTEEQSRVLSRLGQGSSLSKSEILLRGLELLEEYYALGLEQPPLKIELRNLEMEALRHAEALKQIRKKEEAIGQMVHELRDVENILDKYHSDKSYLIQILLDIQEQNHWLPKPALMWVSERLGVPWPHIYHIATFYKAFSLIPRGRHLVQVCLGTACQVRGGPRVLDKVMEVLKIKPGETDQEQKFSLATVNCLGCCALGPVVAVDKDYYSNPSVDLLRKIMGSYK